MKVGKEMIGPAAFYIGLLIAVLAAVLVDPSGKLYATLAVLGIIVALLNITAEEVNMFMISSIAFIVSALGMYDLITVTGVDLADEIVCLAANITVLLGAGVVVIALKAVYQLAKSK